MDAKPGGPVNLAPNSLRLLDKLGVYKKLRGRGYQFSEGIYRDEDGRMVGVSPFGGKAWGYECVRIERAELLDVLKEELQARGTEVEYSCSLREVVSEHAADGVLFHVRKGDKASGKIVEMRTDMLIGCDGVHSKTRTFVLGGHEVLPTYVGSVMLAAKCRWPRLRFGDTFAECQKNDERALGIMTRKGGLIMLPSDPAGEIELYARQFQIPDLGREGWENMDADKTRLVEMMKSEIEEYPDLVQSMLEQAQEKDIYIWAIHTLPKIKKWISAGYRAIVIGDAAHTISPAAGQGANQAIEDAYTLGQVIARETVSEPQHALQKKLNIWQAHRSDRVDRVANLSIQLMNSRLPPEERAKLSPDLVYDLSGAQEDQVERLRWLFAPNLMEREM